VKDVYYPSGEIFEVKSFKGFDVIGFYWVSFNQVDLASKNLPNIYARKTGVRNEWDYKGEIKQYLLSNVILKMFLIMVWSLSLIALLIMLVLFL